MKKLLKLMLFILLLSIIMTLNFTYCDVSIPLGTNEENTIEDNAPIEFDNPPLENFIREKINKLGDIYKKDLEGIDKIYGFSNEDKLTTLQGIEYLTNLNYLNIGSNKIHDLTPLFDLPNLTNLSVDAKYLKDLRQIEKLKNLENLSISNLASEEDLNIIKNITGLKTLTISNTSISDFSALSSLSNLESLILDGNNIDDISFVKNLTKIKELNLSDNHIEDLTPISHLTNLTKLDITSNKVQDLTPIGNLKNLETLFAENNFIRNIEGLKSCINLKILSLDNNFITDISPLAYLDNITNLKLSDNLISDISAIRNMKKLETIYIDSNPILDVTPAIEKSLRNGSSIDFLKTQEAGKKAHNIVKQIIKKNMKDIEKEKAIYNYLINNVKIHNIWDPTSDGTSGDIYGALNRGVAGSEGYAKAMKVLCHLAGLDCIYVEGTLNNSNKHYTYHHCWNMVKIDGHYYHVDVSWDDGGYSGKILENSEYYVPPIKFFNISDSDMLKYGKRTWNINAYPRTTAFDDPSHYDPHPSEYKISYYPDKPMGKDLPFLITNEKDIVLPPYSAILYNITNQEKDAVKNSGLDMGNILVANHAKKKVTIKKGEILKGHHGITNGLDVYYRIIVFKNDFNEKDIISKGISGRKDVLYAGNWIYDGLVPNVYDDKSEENEAIIGIAKVSLHNGNINNGQIVLEKDGYCYANERDSNGNYRLAKTSISTGKKVILHENKNISNNYYAKNIKIHGKYLYFSYDDEGLYRLNLETGHKELLVKAENFRDSLRSLICITDEEICYISVDGYNIYRIDRNTMITEPLSFHSFGDMTIVGDSIYYIKLCASPSSENEICKYNLKTGRNGLLSQIFGNSLISDGQYLYYVMYDPYTYEYSICKSDLNCKNKELIFKTNEAIYNLNMDGDKIYLSTLGKVYKIGPEKQAEVVFEGYCEHIIVGEKYIHIVDNDGTIDKMIPR
ncbi:leucine-rich repeat domain-containing protein [Lutispora thermophila]|uniref:Leucine-rich repeat (LRR) protein n=1 Tax=Lutispora thermophila DSM 19022 TaxID=1122184 RepID=A0A1M6BZZ0_9FIRM|nr:leucine-rich repeat domain-containing protein [Lutispora thermophila]SHI54044.1 Leucine-rich repeat (LRR) protein [Lutispora thermophila DSM 19022]